MRGATGRVGDRVWGVCLALALAVIGCAGGEPEVGAMAPEELAQRIEAGSAPFVLDVRSRDEFAAGHVPGAVNVPHTELADRLGELDVAPDAEIVVYCQSGRRAGIASDLLAEAGYVGVVPLEGHWARWSASDLPRE